MIKNDTKAVCACGANGLFVLIIGKACAIRFLGRKTQECYSPRYGYTTRSAPFFTVILLVLPVKALLTPKG